MMESQESVIKPQEILLVEINELVGHDEISHDAKLEVLNLIGKRLNSSDETREVNDEYFSDYWRSVRRVHSFSLEKFEAVTCRPRWVTKNWELDIPKDQLADAFQISADKYKLYIQNAIKISRDEIGEAQRAENEVVDGIVQPV